MKIWERTEYLAKFGITIRLIPTLPDGEVGGFVATCLSCGSTRNRECVIRRSGMNNPSHLSCDNDKCKGYSLYKSIPSDHFEFLEEYCKILEYKRRPIHEVVLERDIQIVK